MKGKAAGCSKAGQGLTAVKSANVRKGECCLPLEGWLVSAVLLRDSTVLL